MAARRTDESFTVLGLKRPAPTSTIWNFRDTDAGRCSVYVETPKLINKAGDSTPHYGGVFENTTYAIWWAVEAGGCEPGSILLVRDNSSRVRSVYYYHGAVGASA